MPRYSRRGGRSSRAGASSGLIAPNTFRTGRDYGSEQTGVKRHDMSLITRLVSSPLTAGEYIPIPFVRFERSFDPGTPDTEDTPSASNNYATPFVMNGSKVVDFSANVKIINQDGNDPIYLDVYSTAVSFSDVLYWDELYETSCPYSFSAIVNREGIITEKTPDVSLINDQNYRDFKGVQHYMKKLGTITIGESAAGDGGLAQLNFKGVPAKCRRMQTGVYYGINIHNNSITNGGRPALLDVSTQINFKELPASNRLPFKW